MPGIFISYRNSDREGAILAHALFRELRKKYGRGNIFLDIDSKLLGVPFPEKIAFALNKANIVLVIIGPQWLKKLNDKINDSSDWVRLEVQASLNKGSIPVIPVRTTTAQFPSPESLPSSIRGLAFRDGISIDLLQNFEQNSSKLFKSLDRILTAKGIVIKNTLPLHKYSSQNNEKFHVDNVETSGSQHLASESINNQKENNALGFLGDPYIDYEATKQLRLIFDTLTPGLIKKK